MSPMYRKKPVVIEAEQMRYGSIDHGLTGEFWDAVCGGCDDVPAGQRQLHVHTLEGPLAVSDRDWIIKGVKGEFYPCKPDIFDATYEAVKLDRDSE